MATIETIIRPRPERLRQLPTLDVQILDADALPEPVQAACQADGIERWMIELKLVARDSRYWLCTRGLPEAQPGVSETYVVGHVLPEHRREDGTWEEGCPYGPREAAFLQGIDYCRGLRDQLRQLKQRQVYHPSREVSAEITALLAEMREVKKTLGLPPILSRNVDSGTNQSIR